MIQALRNIRAWSLANPTRRKTHSGILRHINAWLTKAQNQGGSLSSKNNFSPQVNHINEHNAAVAEKWLSKQKEKEIKEIYPVDNAVLTSNVALLENSHDP